MSDTSSYIVRHSGISLVSHLASSMAATAASFACATVGYSERQWLAVRLSIAGSIAIGVVPGSCAATASIAVSHSDSRSFGYHG